MTPQDVSATDAHGTPASFREQRLAASRTHCKFWLDSLTCPKGMSCQYLHQRNESAPKHLEAVCKFWVNSRSCPKGDSCRFIHHTSEEDLVRVRRDWVAHRRIRRQRLAEKVTDLGDGSEPGGCALLRLGPLPRHMQDGNPHANTKSSRHHRSRVLVDFLVKVYGAAYLSSGVGVVDVAGGRGEVGFELQNMRGIPTTLVEPRQQRLTKHQYKALQRRKQRDADEVSKASTPAACPPALEETEDEFNIFTWNGASAPLLSGSEEPAPSTPRGFSGEGRRRGGMEDDDVRVPVREELCPHIASQWSPAMWDRFKECSLVVGLHPDEASDPIVDFALHHRRPFAIVPCCVFPKLFRRFLRDGTLVTTRQALCKYYLEKVPGAKCDYLDFQGANMIVYRL
eukprot:scaffold1139_cov202-Prasinococcus_capsulatus_cf.AAC.2